MKITHHIGLLALIFLFHALLAEGQELKKYWVFFKDKGNSIQNTSTLQKGSSEYQAALTQLSDRAIKRRLKVLSADQLIDAQDLPLNQSYINTIKGVGGLLQQEVLWMNAASFILTDQEVRAVEQLPFVENVKPVLKFIRRDSVSVEGTELQKTTSASSFDYGPSLAQYEAVKIPEVHELGIAGEGVLIGMLDTGFKWRAQESLQNTHVIAEHDFINNDDTTANQAGDPSGQDLHGTLTMSILGSYMPGKVIGPAFKSDFILGKTEVALTETQIEEDYWAAGIEWMESHGVDVVSSSLGYSTFDGGGGYTWDHGDFNGRTAVTSRAAARAARLGVVVVTAMGNEGNGNGIRGTLLCPADADSILSIGAITIPGTLAYFSSTGPTNDGRIKPDVVTPGVSIYSAQIPGPNTYGSSQGTSAATPIAAGVAALVLSARPELTPLQVRDAIRNTADRIATSQYPQHPNNFVGWGKANALKALSYPSVNFSKYLASIETFLTAPNGVYQDSIKFIYSVNAVTYDTLTMNPYVLRPGRSIGRYRTYLHNLSNGSQVYFKLVGKDSSDNIFHLPEDTTRIYSVIYGDEQVKLDSFITMPIPTTYMLNQNYPNPFNAGTTIRFESPNQVDGILEIYNLLGQRIRDFKLSLNVGRNYFYWDGRNGSGNNAPSGVYFCRIRTKDFVADRKMLLLR